MLNSFMPLSAVSTSCDETSTRLHTINKSKGKKELYNIPIPNITQFSDKRLLMKRIDAEDFIGKVLEFKRTYYTTAALQNRMGISDAQVRYICCRGGYYKGYRLQRLEIKRKCWWKILHVEYMMQDLDAGVYNPVEVTDELVEIRLEKESHVMTNESKPRLTGVN